MGIEFAAERRLLADDEQHFVHSSHYPVLEGLPRDDVVELARRLRGQHGRARDIIRGRRRIRRGKAEPRAGGSDTPSERGLAAKKQVFARALKRVNARLAQMTAAAERARALAVLHEALRRKQASAPHHPSGGNMPGTGMRSLRTRKPRPVVHGARIGSVSQAGRVSQAAADARGR